MKGLRYFLVTIGFAVFMISPSTFAEEPKASGVAIDEDFYREVAYELRCPTCTGLSVLESNASFSEQIKDQVRSQIQEGKTKAEILEFFVERYGPWILREPPKEGFNLLAWYVPIGLLIFGPILIWLFVWRHRAQIDPQGLRSIDSIVEEMNQNLSRMKKGGVK